MVFEAAPSPLPWLYVSRGEPGEAASARWWRLGEGTVPRAVMGITGYYGILRDAFGTQGERECRHPACLGPALFATPLCCRSPRPCPLCVHRLVRPRPRTHAFPPTDGTLARPTSRAPTFQQLSLPGGPGMTLTAQCCGERSYPSPGATLTGQVVVVQTNLQAAFVLGEGDVTAWVTDSQRGGGVAGARVALWFTEQGGQVGRGRGG